MALGRASTHRRVLTRRYRRNQISDEQLEILISYMEQHLLFARGQIPRLGPQGHKKYQSMWVNLANTLNAVGPSIRDVLGWQRLWTKLRLEAKLEKMRFLHEINRTGHNTPTRILNHNNERISDIYGKYGTGANLGRELGIQLTIQNESEELSSDDLSFNKVSERLLDAIPEILCSLSTRLEMYERSKIINKPNELQMDGLVFRMGLAENRELAHGDAGAEDWQPIAVDLNEIAGGCKKSAKSWSKTWADLVGTAKQNLQFLLEGIRTTPLSARHVEVLRILGQDLPPMPAEAESSFGNDMHGACGVVNESRAWAVNTTRPVARVPPASTPRKPTFCGFNQLYSPLLGTPTSRHSSAPPLKRPHMDAVPSTSNPQSSGFDNSGSTGFFNSGGSCHGNAASEKATKLMKAIEAKAAELLGTMMTRFEERLELQTGLIQSYLENQNRILLDNLPIMLHQEMTALTQSLQCTQVQRESAEEITTTEPVASTSDETEGNECPICHDQLEEPKKLSCDHVFCKHCIKTWLLRSSTCPICREKIDKNMALRDNILTFYIDSDSDDSLYLQDP